MGVKWTCALFCLLGIAFLQIEAASTFGDARIRDRRAAESDLAMNRMKRDVNSDGTNQHSSSSTSTGNGGSSSSSSSSWSSSSGSGTSGGGGGTSFSSSGPGFSGVGSRSGFGDASDNVGQSWSFPANQNNPGFDNQNFIPNVGSYPYYPNQYAVPNQAYNFHNFLEQYFRNLQAQQEIFRSQFQNPGQSGIGSWAQAAAFTTGPNGGISSNGMAHTHVSTGGSNGGTIRSNQAVDNQQRSFGQNNRLDYGSSFNPYPNNFGFNNRAQFGNDFGNFGGFNQRFPNSAGGGIPSSFGQSQGVQTAQASASLGPRGGFQTAEISPASPGISSRFAETIPASNGHVYGTFSSSSTKSVRGPDGKVVSEKSATTGTNNNGNITFRTVHDP